MSPSGVTTWGGAPAEVARLAGAKLTPRFNPTRPDGTEGWLECDDVAQADLEAAAAAFDPVAYQQAQEAERQRIESLKTDATRLDLLEKLKRATPAQISSYVDNNVTDLASARALFKRILLVMALIARE